MVTARWFGITEGLLPDNPRIRRMVAGPVPEIGLIVGVVLVAAGLAVSFYALATWNNAGFGRLNYPHTLRIVIPGATLIACGIQTTLSALFVGVLGLRRRLRGRRATAQRESPKGNRSASSRRRIGTARSNNENEPAGHSPLVRSRTRTSHPRAPTGLTCRSVSISNPASTSRSLNSCFEYQRTCPAARS